MSRAHPEPWFRPSRRTFYVTINGVQHNLHTADEAEAFQRWHELVVNLAQVVPVSAGDQAPVTVLLAEFLEWVQRHKSQATYDWHSNYLKRFIASVPRKMLVAELKPYHVTQWLDRHPKWGTNSRRGAVTSLKRAFLWAVQEGYLERSPVATVRKSPSKTREVILTEEQRSLIMATARDPQFRDVLTLLQETGARPQEVRAVAARHVDVKQSLWIFPPAEHKTGSKTGRPRLIYLTPTALAITKRLMELHADGPLCRNSCGRPWTKTTIRDRFKRIRRRLKGKVPADLCAYHYRHTFATDALERGVDPITVAELMGHRDATMICRVYQHIAKKTDYMRTAVLRATGQSVSAPGPA